MLKPIFAVLLAVAWLLPITHAHAEERFTVEHLLSLEEVGKVKFDRTGTQLYFERFGPFKNQSDFGRLRVAGSMRSKIYTADLQGAGGARLLFDQLPGDGYTFGSISPDSTHASYSRVSKEGLSLGVVRLSDGHIEEFPLSPGYNPELDPVWMGRSQLVVEALRLGEVDLLVGIGREAFQEVAERWEQRNAGEIPTAGRIGSGRFASLPEAKGSLMLADARSGQLETLAKGAFSAWHRSPDGSALAALREVPLRINTGQLIEHGANIGGVQRQLLVFRFGLNGKVADVLSPCEGCDVLLSSLNWASSAPLLSFVARQSDQDWGDGAYYIYDHRNGETRAANLGRLSPHPGRAGMRLYIRSAWIGERLAVYANAPGSSGMRDARADWYLLGDGTPTNLTSHLKGGSPELIGLTSDALIILHDGEAWSVEASGERTNLTENVQPRVQEWKEPTVYANLPVSNLQPVSSIALQIRSDKERVANQLLIVDLQSGRIDTIKAPSANSQFLAVSFAQRQAALTEKSSNLTQLLVVGANGARKTILTLNKHLEGVVGGTPIRIDHKGPKGDSRVSWLLAPPGYEKGRPVPTIVNVYPGWSGRETYSRSRLDQMSPLNDHILAAHGYAVLYPSLPVNYEEVPRDPLKGLVDEVFAAIDAAVEDGFVDPNSLAVQGQSYGGYATGALVGLTDRFKSAVAMAGLYNLVSAYGQFDIRQRIRHESYGLDLLQAGLLETSQGGMGAPPWDDIERYLRNSPLMHVKDIDTPIMLLTGDQDFVSTAQSEEFFTALWKLNKDAVFVRYYGEEHVNNSPANIRDMWKKIFRWYHDTLGPPHHPAPVGSQPTSTAEQLKTQPTRN